MKIAVACKDDHVTHFGFCDAFAIYEFKGDYSTPVGKEIVPTEGKRGHSVLTEILNSHDVAMVLCDGMGPDSRNALLDFGIMPVAGYQGEADTGAIELMRGNIPITQSSCDSCGGNCSSGRCGE